MSQAGMRYPRIIVILPVCVVYQMIHEINSKRFLNGEANEPDITEFLEKQDNESFYDR